MANLSMEASKFSDEVFGVLELPLKSAELDVDRVDDGRRQLRVPVGITSKLRCETIAAERDGKIFCLFHWTIKQQFLIDTWFPKRQVDREQR